MWTYYTKQLKVIERVRWSVQMCAYRFRRRWSSITTNRLARLLGSTPAEIIARRQSLQNGWLKERFEKQTAVLGKLLGFWACTRITYADSFAIWMRESRFGHHRRSGKKYCGTKSQSIASIVFCNEMVDEKSRLHSSLLLPPAENDANKAAKDDISRKDRDW